MKHRIRLLFSTLMALAASLALARCGGKSAAPPEPTSTTTDAASSTGTLVTETGTTPLGGGNGSTGTVVVTSTPPPAPVAIHTDSGATTATLPPTTTTDRGPVIVPKPLPPNPVLPPEVEPPPVVTPPPTKPTCVWMPNPVIPGGGSYGPAGCQMPEKPPTPDPGPLPNGNCVTIRAGNLGTNVLNLDIPITLYKSQSNAIMYFVPSLDGKSGKVFNWWYVKTFPAGVSLVSYSDYRDIGGAIENCNGAGQDFSGRPLHRMAKGTLYPNGLRERAARKIYQKGMTVKQNPQFDDTNFNVVVLNHGYQDAVGFVPAVVIQTALNAEMKRPAEWVPTGVPCASWPCK